MNNEIVLFITFVSTVVALLLIAKLLILVKKMPKPDLTKKQVKALKYLQKYEKITNNDYEKLVSVSDSKATADLEVLERAGFITQTGKGRGTYYTKKK